MYLCGGPRGGALAIIITTIMIIIICSAAANSTTKLVQQAQGTAAVNCALRAMIMIEPLTRHCCCQLCLPLAWRARGTAAVNRHCCACPWHGGNEVLLLSIGTAVLASGMAGTRHCCACPWHGGHKALLLSIALLCLAALLLTIALLPGKVGTRHCCCQSLLGYYLRTAFSFFFFFFCWTAIWLSC